VDQTGVVIAVSRQALQISNYVGNVAASVSLTNAGVNQLGRRIFKNLRSLKGFIK
jgi:hypothetical protein